MPARIVLPLLVLFAALAGLSCALVVSFADYETPPSFPVSGTVDGLEGASASLTLNGGTPLEVKDGAFRFPPNEAVVDRTS